MAFQFPLVNATMDAAQLEPRHYRAIAFQKQAEEGILDRLHRYRVAASREFTRMLAALRTLRNIPPSNPPATEESSAETMELPNEPTVAANESAKNVESSDISNQVEPIRLKSASPIRY